WGKLPRIVRDLAVATGKQLELSMSGQETEIDRQILDAIQDPLIHCVRNSGDHGIESPEVRQQRGKPATGTITLNAFHEGGQIVIEIKDDGGGINIKAVREKAIERGIVKKEVAEQLSDAQISRFIFEAGFSTAKQVTEVSGRGVGMDVVRTNIEKIGGSVELSSEQGIGTVLRIKIPLTLAIISALIVKSGGEQGEVFAIPQVGVLELVRVSESSQHLIEDIHGSKVLRLRDKLLPLINLATVLGIETKAAGQAAGEPKDMSVVVAQVGSTEFGLCVDEIFDTQEIVVKPVGRLLREINLFAGSTIMGDGRVIIILDTTRIAAKVIAKTTESEESLARNGVETQKGGDKTTLLLFRGNDSAPLAVPLALISRLEEFPVSKLEQVDGRYLVQYRGGLLPLVPCQESVTINSKNDQPIHAIIFSDGKRSMGLIVSEIIDIVEENLSIESSGKKVGILGAAIVAGKGTEIIDTYYFLQRAYPDWFDNKRASKKDGKNRILLVDDSSFFRDLIRPILEAKGYFVKVACDGAQAYQILESGEAFDLVMSDIEMPVMDGLSLAAKLKQSPSWKNLPMLALTSLASPEDKQRGLDAGFSDYLVKFDQDILVSTIASLLKKPVELAAVEGVRGSSA
ncbi:MAG: hybrid sensor histidine kinase/response regulator, partial [Bdellovibrionota bacterium]